MTYMTANQAQQQGFGPLFDVASDFAFTNPQHEHSQVDASPFPTKHPGSRELHHVWISGTAVGRTLRYEQDDQDAIERRRKAKQAMEDVEIRKVQTRAALGFLLVTMRPAEVSPENLLDLLDEANELVNKYRTPTTTHDDADYALKP